MAVLSRQRSCIFQPQYPTVIDRSGIGAKARFALLGTKPQELLTGVNRTGAIGTGVATTNGIAYSLPSALSVWAASVPDLDPYVSGSFSCFWYGVLRTNNAQRLLRYANTSNSAGWTFITAAVLPNTVTVDLVTVGSSQGVTTGAIPIVDNSIHSVSFVYDADTTSVDMFFDGQKVSTKAWPRDSSATDASPIFTMFSAGVANPHKMLTVQAYAGKLSTHEVVSLSNNPWQIFRASSKRIQNSTVTIGGVTYNISPSGSIALSGTAYSVKTKFFLPTGDITFSGTNILLKQKLIVPQGNITISGGSPVIKTKIVDASGFLTFSGTSPMIRSKVIESSGGILLSGTASLSGAMSYTLTPTGSVVLTGSSSLIKTHIQIPTGRISFSGNAPLESNTVIIIVSTRLPLTGVGK